MAGILRISMERGVLSRWGSFGGIISANEEEERAVRKS